MEDIKFQVQIDRGWDSYNHWSTVDPWMICSIPSLNHLCIDSSPHCHNNTIQLYLSMFLLVLFHYVVFGRLYSMDFGNRIHIPFSNQNISNIPSVILEMKIKSRKLYSIRLNFRFSYWILSQVNKILSQGRNRWKIIDINVRLFLGYLFISKTL